MQVIKEADSIEMPNLATKKASEVKQQLAKIDHLVTLAFPAAPAPIIKSIAEALYTKQALEWANWAFTHCPEQDLDEGLHFAFNALFNIGDAKRLAWGVFNGNKAGKGPIIGFATPEGYIVGTANFFEDYVNEEMRVQDLCNKARNEIIENLPELKSLLVQVDNRDATALSIDKWKDFCSYINDLQVLAAKTIIAGLQLFLELGAKHED